MNLSDAFEIIEYCLYEGKIDLDSAFETDLYTSLVTQINEFQDSLQAIQIRVRHAVFTGLSN